MIKNVSTKANGADGPDVKSKIGFEKKKIRSHAEYPHKQNRTRTRANSHTLDKNQCCGSVCARVARARA